MSRAGRHSRTRARIARDEFFRKHFLVFATVLAIWAITASVVIWLTKPWLRPYLIGSSITIGLWLFSAVLSLSDDVRRYDAGGAAEQWTSKELRRLGRGWRVIDGVEFADGDVDHVLVGPGGIFAVETKWSSHECDLDMTVLPWGIEAGLHQATAAARKIRLLLWSKKMRADVQPVLVIWGPKVERAANSYVDVGPVRLIVGAQASGWRATLEGSEIIGEQERQAAADAIEQYVRAHRPHELHASLIFRRRQSA